MMGAVPSVVLNPTLITVSLATPKNTLDGGVGTVVIDWTFDAGDLPFELVANILKEYTVFGINPIKLIVVAAFKFDDDPIKLAFPPMFILNAPVNVEFAHPKSRDTFRSLNNVNVPPFTL